MLTLAATDAGHERILINSVLAKDENSKKIRTVLYHTHLPRLTDAGFLECELDAESIARGPQVDEIKPDVTLQDGYLDRTPGD